jgi:hypothetical protein
VGPADLLDAQGLYSVLLDVAGGVGPAVAGAVIATYGAASPG